MPPAVLRSSAPGEVRGGQLPFGRTETAMFDFRSFVALLDVAVRVWQLLAERRKDGAEDGDDVARRPRARPRHMRGAKKNVS